MWVAFLWCVLKQAYFIYTRRDLNSPSVVSLVHNFQNPRIIFSDLSFEENNFLGATYFDSMKMKVTRDPEFFPFYSPKNFSNSRNQKNFRSIFSARRGPFLVSGLQVFVCTLFSCHLVCVYCPRPRCTPEDFIQILLLNEIAHPTVTFPPK